MNQETKKKSSAKAAFDLIKPNLNKDSVLGIGTGSTTNFFIDELNTSNIEIKAEQIELPSSIKSKGEFKFKVNLHADVQSEVSIEVLAKE